MATENERNSSILTYVKELIFHIIYKLFNMMCKSFPIYNGEVEVE